MQNQNLDSHDLADDSCECATSGADSCGLAREGCTQKNSNCFRERSYIQCPGYR